MLNRFVPVLTAVINSIWYTSFFVFFFTCRLACAHGRTRSLSKRALFDTYLRIRVRITTTRATPPGLEEAVRSREAGLLV